MKGDRQRIPLRLRARVEVEEIIKWKIGPFLLLSVRSSVQLPGILNDSFILYVLK